MKKIIYFIATLLFFTNCNVDDDSIESHFEILPIESINLPQQFILGETYTIEFTFIRPTNCHAYDHIINMIENENRTFSVKSVVFEQNNCTNLTTNNIATQSIEFKVTHDQTYLFHIWKGKDSQGIDIYDDYSIPVV